MATDHQHYQHQQHAGKSDDAAGAPPVERTATHDAVTTTRETVAPSFSEGSSGSSGSAGSPGSAEVSGDQRTILTTKRQSRLEAEGWVGVGGGAAGVNKKARGRVGDYWGGGSGSAVPEDMYSHLIVQDGECWPTIPDEALGEAVSEEPLTVRGETAVGCLFFVEPMEHVS